MHLIHYFLEHHAQTLPEHIACIQVDGEINYGALDKKANQYANALIQMGVKKGDRVALYLDNSIDYIAAYYGILKAGATTVAVYKTATERTLHYIFNDCQVKAVITQKPATKIFAELNGQIPDLHSVVAIGKGKIDEGLNRNVCTENELVEMPDTKPEREVDEQDIASIIYTSGSTGDPRGAVLTHKNIVTNTRSIVKYLKLTKDDRVLVILPFPYVYGASLLNTHFSVGGSVVLENRFLFPNVALKTMKETQATGFSGVPSTYAILLHKTSIREMEFPHLRYITQAGGAMAPQLIREVMEVFAQQKVFIMYGATEASARLSYLDPEVLPQKVGSIGKAIPDVDLRILRDDGTEADVGETGEIVARGDNIMQGYWNAPEETANVLDAHGFHTGDLGRRDEEGYLYVVGRKRDMIKSGANRVSAKEVEEVLCEYPAILEAAVIGVADDILGEAIHAFVVAKNGDGIVEKDVMAFCREKMPEFKVPRKVVVEKTLPKNASGKLMKEELRKRYQ
ncbi:MAG: acyl--CoA ligase [Deferribacteres bacterium]|nr:acyl--CoA ligase [candidate division KSB1 bacterium]MCB9504113.1 acyl--CoA ligase [Deferribacteres bacterium]